MKQYKHENNRFTSEVSNIQDSPQSFSFSVFFERIHSISSLHLIAGLSQIFLGFAVVTISILGLIQPLWLSTFFTMAASVTAMIGCYLVYITVSKLRDPNALIHGAMKRVAESKN